MTKFTVTRAGALSSLVGLALLIVAPPAAAARNESAERHVLLNANAALHALADPSLSPMARQTAFRSIMTHMVDVPRIATFVLGRYGVRVRSDPGLRALWLQTFEDHMLAVYKDQLDRFAGSQVRIAGSFERVPGRDVVVRSEMTSPSSGRTLSLQWRILQGETGWKVTDISFVADGAEIWLAQQQQSEFALQLDRGGGDINALISSVRARTDDLRQRSEARASE